MLRKKCIAALSYVILASFEQKISLSPKNANTTFLQFQTLQWVFVNAVNCKPNVSEATCSAHYVNFVTFPLPSHCNKWWCDEIDGSGFHMSQQIRLLNRESASSVGL